MVFDADVNRAIRKKFLRDPNPQKVSVERSATLETILDRARELYFKDMDVELDELSLCDSSGILIPVQDDNWTVGSFYQKNNLQPSRFKLYVALIKVRH